MNELLGLDQARSTTILLERQYRGSRARAIVLGAVTLAAASTLGYSIGEGDLKKQSSKKLVIVGETLTLVGLAIGTAMEVAHARSIKALSEAIFESLGLELPKHRKFAAPPIVGE